MRRTLMALALACVAVAVVSFPPAPASAVDVSALHVYMLGDSVLLGAKDEIMADFAGSPVTVDARQSLSLLGGISTLADVAGSNDVVVLDLGYNDGTDLDAWRDRIGKAMTALAPAKHVVWLNQRAFQSGRAEMNRELSAAAAQYPNLDVGDWNAVVASRPDLVEGDGIHLTPAGRVAMAALIRSRLEAYVTAVAPTTPTTTPAPSTRVPTSPIGHSSSARVRPAISMSSSWNWNQIVW